MQGVFVFGSRPPTKKALILQVEEINHRLSSANDKNPLGNPLVGADPYSVVIEATSMIGNEFDGSLGEALRTNNHGPFYIVGPDPRESRKWYATLTFDPEKNEWQVK